MFLTGFEITLRRKSVFAALTNVPGVSVWCVGGKSAFQKKKSNMKFHFRLVLAQNMLRICLVSVLCDSPLAWKEGTKQCLQDQSRARVVPQC